VIRKEYSWVNVWLGHSCVGAEDWRGTICRSSKKRVDPCFSERSILGQNRSSGSSRN
jgi:hypothetical protein